MFSKNLTRDTHSKTLVKTICYRLISVLITVVLTLVLGGNLAQALAMGTIVMSIAIMHYYIYDRLWLYIDWQRSSSGNDSQTRTLVKSVIYRITALLVTAAIARMVFADTNLIAMLLASIKFVVNLAAYYMVERVFNAWHWGRERSQT
jgi:uncharacterized membrane protein